MWAKSSLMMYYVSFGGYWEGPVHCSEAQRLRTALSEEEDVKGW